MGEPGLPLCGCWGNRSFPSAEELLRNRMLAGRTCQGQEPHLLRSSAALKIKAWVWTRLFLPSIHRLPRRPLPVTPAHKLEVIRAHAHVFLQQHTPSDLTLPHLTAFPPPVKLPRWDTNQCISSPWCPTPGTTVEVSLTWPVLSPLHQPPRWGTLPTSPLVVGPTGILC